MTLPINLGQFVKVAGLASTGGEAKYLIVSGMVAVNGEIDTRRGRKMAGGDVVSCGGKSVSVDAAPVIPTATER